MEKEFIGKTIVNIEVNQEKCLNMKCPDFMSKLENAKVENVRAKGKWLILTLTGGQTLLLNLGMGADLLYSQTGEKQKKYQILFRFDDSSLFTVRFWWFGYAHIVNSAELNKHKMFGVLGEDPISDDFNYDKFCHLLAGKKISVKNFLTNQKYIAGIGNVYVQDILFRSGIHPSRKVSEISEQEKMDLFSAMKDDLKRATAQGGLIYEKDLYGHSGRFNDFKIAYREGSLCSCCGSTIKKIKSGATASYICPHCQK